MCDLRCGQYKIVMCENDFTTIWTIMMILAQYNSYHDI